MVIDVPKLCCVVVLLPCWFSINMALADPPQPQYSDAITLHVAQGVGQGLETIPEHIILGHITWEAAYFTAITWSKVIASPADSAWTHGYEVNVLQHRGLQHNTEVAVAYDVRTGNLNLAGLQVNLAFGVGLSYALGTPSYEDGSKDEPLRRYRWQLFLPIELEWSRFDQSNFSWVTRIHHRSGVYGLIAPKGVGSNFISTGLRYYF
ncbi:MAG: hypothetical protein Q9M19_04050 [Mariprofundaceae bacterium]|nr:hypothetical protein [Mariprofundaceae bacterium]